MYNQPHWDIYSLLFYLLLAMTGGVCSYYIYHHRTESSKMSRYLYYAIWFCSWEIAATFRRIGSFIGGADSLAYIRYFNNCLLGENYQVQSHFGADLMYRYINQLVRIFTNNYHVLFFIIYAILMLSYFFTLKNFNDKRYSCIPYFIIFYIYLRGFVTFRTNLSVAMILFSLCCWKNKRNKLAVVFAILSVFFQRASILYAVIILFLYLVERKNVSIYKCILGILAMAVLGRVGQYIVANYNIPFLEHGAYRYYILYANEGSTFFDGFWKVALPQILLLILMFLFRKDIKMYEEKLSHDGKSYTFRLTKMICYFDIMTIPATFILHVWRGYEYLYIFRLIMWGALIEIISQKFEERSRRIVKIFIWCLFIGWMAFRIYNTWEDSGLMPFSFDFSS